MNHVPGALSLVLVLVLGYFVLALDTEGRRQRAEIEKLRGTVETLQRKQEETARSVGFFDDQIFALKEDLKELAPAPQPYITRPQLEAALAEQHLILDEKLKPLLTRPLELKIWDMANPTAEITPLLPVPEKTEGVPTQTP